MYLHEFTWNLQSLVTSIIKKNKTPVCLKRIQLNGDWACINDRVFTTRFAKQWSYQSYCICIFHCNNFQHPSVTTLLVQFLTSYYYATPKKKSTVPPFCDPMWLSACPCNLCILFKRQTAVDGRNRANQLSLVVYPDMVSDIPGVFWRFSNQQ